MMNGDDLDIDIDTEYVAMDNICKCRKAPHLPEKENINILPGMRGINWSGSIFILGIITYYLSYSQPTSVEIQ